MEALKCLIQVNIIERVNHISAGIKMIYIYIMFNILVFIYKMSM